MALRGYCSSDDEDDSFLTTIPRQGPLCLYPRIPMAFIRVLVVVIIAAVLSPTLAAQSAHESNGKAGRLVKN
jgi:hypothetical protein